MSAAAKGDRLGHWLLVVASLVVLATLVAAFMVMRSPSAQREVTLDQRRVMDLTRLGHAVDTYANLHGGMPPQELAVLAQQPGSGLPRHDPVSARPYAYQRTGDDRYFLCAVFATDTAKTGEAAMQPYGDAWAHGAGRHCFDRVVQGRAAKAAAPASAPARR